MQCVINIQFSSLSSVQSRARDVGHSWACFEVLSQRSKYSRCTVFITGTAIT